MRLASAVPMVATSAKVTPSYLPPSQYLLCHSPASQNVYYGEDTPLNLSINPVPETIQWEPANLLSCSDCLNPTVLQPSANTDFTLSLQDEKGCQQTAVFRLLVEEKIRSLFSPMF